MVYEIESVRAREVLDSRGNPTIEVELKTGNCVVRSIVPSGASTGVHEALELRDNDERFHGRGVRNAVGNVNDKISKAVTGMDCCEQENIDGLMIELDGTVNKSNLGANAILGVSMCLTRASAVEMKIPLYERVSQISGGSLLLPTPSMNVINGGAHAGNQLDIQEYMILPTGAESFAEGVRMCSEVYHELKGIIRDRYGRNAVNVGDEGGFAPPLEKPEDPLDLILKATEELGYPGIIEVGIDAAASGFYKGGSYLINGKEMDGSGLGNLYEHMLKEYPIISIEDPFAEDDWDSWVRFTGLFSDSVQIMGDDLLVTNVERMNEALERGACNALLLKINQIGTITEGVEAARLAFVSDWNVMVSHRSGETEDPFIADLAVGLGAGQIKSGAPCRSERNAKYNQLLRIEEELGGRARYNGGI